MRTQDFRAHGLDRQQIAPVTGHLIKQLMRWSAALINPEVGDLGRCFRFHRQVVMEFLLETKAATILQFFAGLRGTLSVTFEEGPGPPGCTTCVLNFPTGALAHLELARTYALEAPHHRPTAGHRDPARNCDSDRRRAGPRARCRRAAVDGNEKPQVTTSQTWIRRRYRAKPRCLACVKDFNG
jgi:hypothetical protein